MQDTHCPVTKSFSTQDSTHTQPTCVQAASFSIGQYIYTTQSCTSYFIQHTGQYTYTTYLRTSCFNQHRTGQYTYTTYLRTSCFNQQRTVHTHNPPAYKLLADDACDAALLQYLSAHVQGQVAAVHHTLNEVQVPADRQMEQ